MDIRNSKTVDNNNNNNNLIIAIDRTGTKITNRGQWMPDKWYLGKKKRISQDSCSCKYKDQGNSCTRGNRREGI